VLLIGTLPLGRGGMEDYHDRIEVGESLPDLAKPNINARTLVGREARARRWRDGKATEQGLKFEKRSEERRMQREEWERRNEEMRRERAHTDARFEQILALVEQFRDRASLDNE
jgi:hypothetical protein